MSNHATISGKLEVAEEIGGMRLVKKEDVDRLAEKRKAAAAS